MWLFKRKPNFVKVTMQEFREDVDGIIGRVLKQHGFERGQPRYDVSDDFDEKLYVAGSRAISIVMSIHYEPAICLANLMHHSSKFDTALLLEVPIIDYVTANSQGQVHRTYRDYLRENHPSTRALLEQIRDDLLNYCRGFLNDDFEEFKRLYSCQHPDWTWRAEKSE
jgi:hypothetical protein